MQVAAQVKLIQQVEKPVGVTQVSDRFQGRRTAQVEPGALHPAPQRHPALQRAGLLKHITQARRPVPAVRAQRGKPLLVLQAVPDGVVPGIRTERQQVRQFQSAPGRAQQGKPGHAVSRVMQGTGQRQQVLDNGTGLQVFNLDRLKRDFALCQ